MSGDFPALHRLESAVRPGPGAGIGGPFVMFVNGTVNIVGGGAGGTSMVDNNPFTPGGTSITPAGGYFGGRTVSSGNAAAPAISASAILQVHVVAGGAGGGLSQIQVVGSDNANFNNVGFPSGGTFLNTMPVFGQGGSFPVVGSVNVVQGTLPLPVVGSVNVSGTIAVGNAVVIGGQPILVQGFGGSMGVGQLGAPWSMVGSVGVTPLATFTVALDKIPTINLGLGTVNVGNFPAVQVADIRGSLAPTQWIISLAGSGRLVVAGSAPASQKTYITSYRLIATGTTDISWESPSGIMMTGSMRILPGAGLVDNGGPMWPVLIGSQQSVIDLFANGTQNIGGWAVGWQGP